MSMLSYNSSSPYSNIVIPTYLFFAELVHENEMILKQSCKNMENAKVIVRILV